MHHIETNIDASFESQIAAELLMAAAQATLHHLEVAEGELTILVSHDEMLAALNQTYRGIPSTTDVLSFPSGDAPTIPNQPRYLGDIAISLPQALKQAKAAGHPLSAELQLLVVHGTLHLMGYDHAEPNDKQQMWEVQGEILHKLGVALQKPLEG